MDKNEFEGKWQIIKDQSKIWWSLITDNDLDRVAKADKFFEHVTIHQLKYGYERQVVKDEVGKRVAEYETKLQTIITTRPISWLIPPGAVQTDKVVVSCKQQMIQRRIP